MAVEQEDSGIYYLIGDAIPIQLVIVPKLSKEHNYWLNNLRNDLKAGSEIKNFIENYGKNKNSKLYQSLADAVMRANWEKLKEGSNMCEALKELMAEEFQEQEELVTKRVTEEVTAQVTEQVTEEFIRTLFKHITDADKLAELLNLPVEQINKVLNR